jgi:Type II secretory pathway, component HofQ
MKLQLISIMKNYITLLLFCLVAYFLAMPADNSIADDAMQVKSVDVAKNGDDVEIKIVGINIVASTIYELPNPERIVVDLASAVLDNAFTSQVNVNGITLQTRQLNDSQPATLRLEFYLPEKMTFQATKNNNEIKLVLKQTKSTVPDVSGAGTSMPMEAASKALSGAKNQRTSDKISSVIGSSKNIDSQLPDINPLDAKLSSRSKTQQMEEAFNFSGYNKERITVEFQKMDLHNVFNFLRQVSGANIVVDESVQGSLTLVLDDVPWDFALDIILNLKDLEKEERYNTLVIYPKKKEFKWPDKISNNNLSFQADARLVEREALTIRQQANQPVEHYEAKQEIIRGNEAERDENFEQAVSFYERAHAKWASNNNLTNKIASIYLVHLGQFAKSLYYSNISLKRDPNNNEALLLAAIASANMQDNNKALNYFNKSVNTKKPMKEALMSYSSFCEDTRDYNCAIHNLERYNSLYGEDFDSMINTARIYDKMDQKQKAAGMYKKLLSSGHHIPPDLERYIKSRVTIN